MERCNNTHCESRWPLIDRLKIHSANILMAKARRSSLWRLTEAACSHMGDTDLASFLYCDRTRVSLPRIWSTRFVIPGYGIDQSCVDVEEVDPHFVMAALICGCQACRTGLRRHHAHESATPQKDPAGFLNPHTSDQSRGTSPGLHQGVETSGIGKLVLAKASLIMLTGPRGRRRAAPLKSPATISTVSLKHYSTDCK